MATAEERLMEWLRDAHAMEEQAEIMLDRTADRIENYPELKAKLRSHLDETKRQRDQVRGCIERRGGSTSPLKDMTGRVVAVVQGLSGMFVGDEVIKATMACYVFEHMEIVSYRVLAAAAREAGDAQTAAVCEGILREEEAMASWLEQHVPEVTQRYLAREEVPGVHAKN